MLLALCVILFAKGFTKDTPSTQNSHDTSHQQQPQTDTKPSVDSTDSESSSVPDISKEDVALAPSQVNTIDVPPLNITVSYKKGVGAFEYEVLRTTNGTKYVEFRSQAVAGTKCTDDQGAFASILVNPSADETATLTTQVTIESDIYGLSLASDSCTGDLDQLAKYQTAFRDAFGLLKKI